ncbi:MAG TPA: hypothetical protein VMD92_17285 [Acidobacteriaceae bacterium]|nr:hypothetical protein [Acidobacteriaceae bacterium]
MHILLIYVINDYMNKSISRFRGPSLILLATVHFLLFVTGLVTASALRHGAHFATPFAPSEQLREFLAVSPTAVRVGSFFLFVCAIPFGIFAVTTVSRLRFMGVRAAGTSIAHLGGLIATVALILCGSVGWILSVPEVLVSAQLVKAVNFLNFLLGGVVFAVGFGLLAAGVSVTCFFMRLLPRWLVAFGMFLAITGEASSLSLVAYPANFFIPITRYLGFIWMFSVAIALTRVRKEAQPARVSDAA